MSSKRGPKVKLMAMPSQNFIALGTTSSSTPSAQQTLSSLKTAPKRDPTEPAVSSSAPKKSKLQLSHHMTRSTGAVQMRRESGDHWEEFALEVDANQLLDKVIDAEDVSDERVEALLCGAVKQLRSQKAKPDSALFLTLCYLAKTRPLLFCTEIVVEAFCSLLKRDSSLSFKSKSNNLVSNLSANILLAVYHDENCWPDTFLKVFIEDSLGERVWVDNEDCKGFVDNILASFNTRLPPKSMMQMDVLSTNKLTEQTSLTSSPNHPTPTDETSMDETPTLPMTSEMKEHLENIAVMSRFTHNEGFVVQYVTDIINEGLNRRQTPSDVSRNMLKLLISTVGLPSVRLIVAQKLEIWIQNPKLTRPAQDLLLALCMNCNENDAEVIAQLVKMRLKTKPLINHFITSIREMLSQSDDTFRLLLRTVLFNEVSPTRSLNNIQLISIMFQHSSDKSTKVLAQVFQEMIFAKEDYLKTLRGLLREIVRALRHEHINFLSFAQYLLEEGQAFAQVDSADFVIKERAVISITDLLTMIMFLSLSPAVKEAFSTTKPDRREIIRNYQIQISNIQSIAVHWLQRTVIKSFRPDRNEYLHSLNKVLFMESAEHYYSRDGWPPENDRNLMFRMTSEVPLLEETLVRMLSMGASKDNPLTSAEAIELSDALIKRAASIVDYDSVTHPVLMIEDKQVFSLLMTNAIYRHPDNITLPPGYEPPNMAISDLYWKVWIQLLILTAHNPSQFGSLGWENYPTLGVLIEMSITNHFEFPPPTKIGDDLVNRELQISAYEKQQILQFESYLAAASTKVQINETNSLLLSKLISMDPLGSARKPPTNVLEQFKQLNSVLRLGHLLCQSRNPDFLLEIIQRQQKQIGSYQTASCAPMPWLVELVESNENNFSMLPVQCLCEFLLGQISEEESTSHVLSIESINKSEKSKRKEKRRKQLKLISHLQTIISSQSTRSKELIGYFMKRLTFQQSSGRILASKALSLVLTTDVNTPEDKPLAFTDVNVWLLEKLPNISNFDFIRSSACDSLRPAILVETVPNFVCHYIHFLSLYDHTGSSELALDCAHILIDRQLITNCIVQQNPLKELFLNSLSKVFLDHLLVKRRPAREIYSWTDAQDHILVQWKNEEAAILHISVVHAMIILLSFGATDSNESAYNDLMNTWFCDPQPQSFLVDTSEEALLIPDWLRLKLLKSSSPRLMDAALRDVEPSQLILFIQSLGLSVSSMERLLTTLDSMVDIDSDGVKEAVIDESLILRVVEVQWMRGVKSGYKFAALLGHKPEESETKVEDKMETQESSVSSVDKEIDFKISSFETDFKQLVSKERENRIKYMTRLLRQLTQELFDKKISVKKLTKLLLNEFMNQMNDCFELINCGEFNALFNIIITFATKDAKHLGLKTEIMSVKNAVKQCSEVKNLTFVNILDRFTTSSKSVQKTKAVKTTQRHTKSHQKSVEELTKLILKSDRELDTNKGLLLERFHKLEPELIHKDAPNPQLSTQLLFSRKCLYLLSLLIHKTSFETLNFCIKSILSDEQNSSDLDASAVLDFLTACLGSPRLWIGRDLNQSKHKEYEDVLNLNESQIKKLIDYVLEEGKVEKRVSLVIKSCCLNDNKINLVVNTLKEMENSNPESSMASEMLFRLYLQIPCIEQPLKLVENDFKINGREPSAIDSVTHNLLTAFTSIESMPSRRQIGYLDDTELSLLKMASKHPILFLRQLPMIPALLTGKINSVVYEVFRSRNYLSTFKRILNILRLLKPYLWNKHVKGLNELFCAYIQLFSDYHRNAGKELLPVLSQFLFLIDDWIKFDAESAKTWIKSKRKEIFDLSLVYPEQILFKSVLSGLPFQMQTPIDKQLSENILLRLRESKGNADKMNTVLNDLDKISDSKPELLQYFVDDLRQLYFNPFSRVIAFKLSVKLLNFNPNLSKAFVPTFCQCLQTNDFYLANLALDYLPEFVILAQEHRSMILKKAFEIGIMGNTNVINNICDSFALLNGQLGV